MCIKDLQQSLPHLQELERWEACGPVLWDSVASDCISLGLGFPICKAGLVTDSWEWRGLRVPVNAYLGIEH